MIPAEQIEAVARKTRKLVELCTVLQEANQLLEEENRLLHERLQAADAEKTELLARIEATRIAGSMKGGAGVPAEMKQRINDFVKEIDKCITVLKK